MERFSADIRLNHSEFDNPGQIEAALERLAAQKVASKDGFRMSPVSTLPAKMFEVMQCGVRRTVDLTDSAIREINGRNVVAACVLVRGVLETSCLLWDLIRRVEQIVEDGDVTDLEKLGKYVSDTLLGHGPKAKTFVLFEGHVVTNVLTIIERLDKQLDAPFMNFYEGLSEHAHPNAHGMVLLYTDRHHEGVTYFTERNERRAKASLILALGALATSLDVIEYALAQHLKLSERLAILAERGIYERRTWPDDTPYPINRRGA